jgi:hypothetical protein
MTYRDNDRIRNPDDPWHRQWGIGSIIVSLVAIVVMAGRLPTCQRVAARHCSPAPAGKFKRSSVGNNGSRVTA